MKKEDVIQVATMIGFDTTEDSIEYVINNYDGYQKMDPTATWNLVVEQLLYEYEDNFPGGKPNLRGPDGMPIFPESDTEFNLYVDEKVTH